MKPMRILISINVIFMVYLSCTLVQAQDPEPDHEPQPDVKWEVMKEYDEHGNLIYYDSSCSHTWKRHGFPEFKEGHPFENLDSLFGDFFHFPEGMFEHHPFAFDHFGEFIDSLDLDYYLNSSFFNIPYGFNPLKDFSDSAWMDPFSPDSLFPNAYMPFDDPHEFFERHREQMERFREEFTFPDDSIHHFHPEWQQLPQHQKKPARVIKI